MTQPLGPLEPEPLAELLGHRLNPIGGEGSGASVSVTLQELAGLDRDIYGAIADSSTPTLDQPIRHLSNAANNSKLWMGVAGGLAALGGPRGRRAAVSGLAAIGLASAVVNQGVKRLYKRERPDRDYEGVPQPRRVKMPDSTSFPSGHSASGFAFASAVGGELPLAGAALRFLAAAVAYSRVHTGVHYPGDAMVGSLIGAGIGGLVVALARTWKP